MTNWMYWTIRYTEPSIARKHLNIMSQYLQWLKFTSEAIGNSNVWLFDATTIRFYAFYAFRESEEKAN